MSKLLRIHELITEAMEWAKTPEGKEALAEYLKGVKPDNEDIVGVVPEYLRPLIAYSYTKLESEKQDIFTMVIKDLIAKEKILDPRLLDNAYFESTLPESTRKRLSKLYYECKVLKEIFWVEVRSLLSLHDMSVGVREGWAIVRLHGEKEEEPEPFKKPVKFHD